jgi:hypothetical protein
MKKLIFTFCLLSMSAFVINANAQSCGTNGPGVCTPQGGPASGGFDGPNTVPCAEQGVAYSHADQFTMFSAFNFQGQQSVDSIEFISIQNLPCGICWAVNKATKRYAANEDGCLTFTGTTTDNAGQYKLALALKAWINGQPTGLDIPASLVDQTGIRLFLRVKAPAGNCASVDTATNYQGNLTASLSCPTGINEVNSNVSALNIVPNPMNTEAVVSFIATNSADFTVRITDITGREVSVKQLDGKVGENRITIERNNLPAGTYFLVVNNGNHVVTKHFAITE